MSPLPHLEESLRFEAVATVAAPDGAAAVLRDPTRPTAAGLNWIAAAGNADSNDSSMLFAHQSGNLVALQILRAAAGAASNSADDDDDGTFTNEEEDDAKSSISVVRRASAPLAAVPVNVAAYRHSDSSDTYSVAVAGMDGSVACYEYHNSNNTFRLRWTVPNAHSHVVADINQTPSASRAMAAVAAGPVHSFEFSATLGLLLLVDAAAGRLDLFHPQTGHRRRVLSHLAQQKITAAAWCRATPRIAVGTASGAVQIYNYTKGGALELQSELMANDSDDNDGDWTCTHLDWFSATQLVAGWARVTDVQEPEEPDDDDDDDPATHEAVLKIIRVAATAATMTVEADLGDAVPFFGVPARGRHAFFTARLGPLLLAAANVGSDVAVVHCSNNNNNSSEWTVVELEWTTPCTADDEFLYPVGLVRLHGGTAMVAVATTDHGGITLYRGRHEQDERFFCSDEASEAMAPQEPVAASDFFDEGEEGEPALIEDDDGVAAATAPGATGIFGGGGGAPSLGLGGAAAAAAATTAAPALGWGGSPASTATAAPAFGQTSNLGGSPAPAPTTPAPAPMFGSGASTPVFGSGSGTPSFHFGSGSGAGGFAALASGNKAASPFAAFSKSGTDDDGAAATSPFDAFKKTSSSPNAIFGVKPLFDTPAPAQQPAEDSPPKVAEAGSTTKEAPETAKPTPAAAAAPAFTTTTTTTTTGGPAAEKAARVFDSFDEEKAGWLPTARAEELVEELGEGFYGDELDRQVAAMDPGRSGRLERAAFVQWYAQLQAAPRRAEGESLSLDSDERAERAEERQKARAQFLKLATTTTTTPVDGASFIMASSFPQLIESLNTTYCEEEHVKTIEQLKKAGDKIYLDDFLDWYVGWLFGGDESSIEESDVDAVADSLEAAAALPAATSGWGDRFQKKAGSWTCESCMVTNDPDKTKCAACETVRPGFKAEPDKKEAATTATTTSASIGAGGFSFGGATDSTAASAGKIGEGGFSFAGGGTAKSDGNTGGFTFGGPPTNSDAGTTSTGGFLFGATEKKDATKSAGTGGLFSTDGICCGLGAKKDGDSSPPTKSVGGFTFAASKAAGDTSYGTDKKAATNDPKSIGDIISSGKTLLEVESEDTADGIDLSSAEAKKAVRVFDSIDTEKAGTLPASKMEDLLDELGEGLHGDELDRQKAHVDPEDTGTLSRTAFVQWYVDYVTTNVDDGDSLDSDEKAEREEEKAKARQCFTKLSQKGEDGRDYILVGQFPELFESMDTTYCEEEHQRTLKLLEKPGGKIFLEDFLQWYIEWLFGGDEDSIQDESDVQAAPAESSDATMKATSGWGSIFAQKEGSWKCDSCMVSNDPDKTQCAACEKPRPGHTPAVKDGSTTDEKPSLSGSIGKGGFSFGGGTTGSSFGFGNASSATSAPAASTAFSFGSGAGGDKGGFNFGSGTLSFGSKDKAAEKSALSSESIKKQEPSSTKIPSSFPPMPTKAPTVFGSTEKLTVAETDAMPKFASTFPPMPTKAPTVFGSNDKQAEPATKPISASSFPPMPTKAPTVFGSSDKQAEPGTKPKSASTFPPMATKAPSVFGGKPVESTAAAKSASTFPPMPTKAPSVFGGKPAESTAAAKSASTFPPISTTASSIFGVPSKPAATETKIGAPGKPAEAETKAATPSSPFPPMPTKAPSVFGEKPAETAQTKPSTFPPMPTKAPSVFGAPSKSAVSETKKPSSSFPPMPTKAPSVFGAPNKPAEAAPKKSPSSFPPMPNKAPSVFGSVPSGPASTPSDAMKPRASAGSVPSTEARQEKLSHCSQQYVDLVKNMNKSLAIVFAGNGGRDEDQLKKDIECHVEDACRALVDFRNISASFSKYKGRAATVLSGKTESSRHILESERLLERLSVATDQGLEEFSTQPLDRQSEQRRRELTSSALLARRHLTILKMRRDTIDTMDTEQGYAVLLQKIVATHYNVKKLDEDTIKIEKRAFDASESLHVSTRPALRSSLILKSPKQNLLRGALSTPSPVPRRKEQAQPSMQKWKTVEQSFRTIEAPSVRKFSLGGTGIQNRTRPSPSTRRLITRSGVVASPKQNLRSQQLFSPSQPETTRTGWDAPSTIEHSKMKQTSFAAPRDLRDTTLSSAARDALTDFGTTPEEVSEALETTKRGMPSRPSASRTAAVGGARRGASEKSTSVETANAPAPATETLGAAKLGSSVASSTSTAKSVGASTKEKLPLSDSDGKTGAFGGMGALGSSLFSQNAKSGSLSSTTRIEALGTSLFGGSDALSSSGAVAASGKEPSAAPETGEKKSSESSEPDYQTLLAQFYQKHDPSKVQTIPKLLEKYKGREKEMCAKLAQKYKVANPLDEAMQSTPAKSANLGSGIGTSSAQTPFSSTGDNTFSSMSQKPPLGASPFGSGGSSSSSMLLGAQFSSASSSPSSSPFGTTTPAPAPSQSPFGTSAPDPASAPSPFASSTPAPVQSPFGTTTPAPAPATSPFAASAPPPVQSPFASSTPAPAFGSMASQSPFGQQSSGAFSSSPFGQSPASSLPFGAPAAAAPSAMAPGSTTFLGKSPRELLTAFYQEKNPTKLTEVDKLLTKYQGKEEHMFRNLAKKYNLDASVFGLSASAPAPSFGATSPGIAGSPGFGQPSALGGGSTFGSPPPSFGGASSGGFGSAASAPSQGFGSASGAASFGSQGFGALAHSPAPAGFGSFGSPPAQATPFSANPSPFGAPRR